MRSLVLGIRICFTENQPGGRASSRAGAGYSVLGIGYLDNVPDIVETRSNNAGGRASSRAGAGYSALGIGYLDNVPDIVETRRYIALDGERPREP